MKIGKKRERKRRVVVFVLILTVLSVFGAMKWVGHQNELRMLEEQERIRKEEAIRKAEEEAIAKAKVAEEQKKAEEEAARLKAEEEAKAIAASEAETKAVDDSYFEDALFIGDSRTQGFQIQSGITKGTFLTYKGLNVSSAMNKPLINRNGKKVTILDAARGGAYSKIFVMLGVNELGWASDQAFIDEYSKLVDALVDAHPEATVYIQSIIYVSEDKSVHDKIYNNKNINRYNDLIQTMAEEKNLEYMDLNQVLANSKGHLIEDASFDGVHLRPDYCKIWYQFLKENVIS